MHELSVCEALVTQVEEIAKVNHADRVTAILLELGPLSGVEADLLEHAYPLAAAGSCAADAALSINTGSVRVSCRVCGTESAVAPNRIVCGSCQAWQVDVISGDELLLVSVELQKARADRAVA